MRFAFRVLLTLTALLALWMLFLYRMLPVGSADSFHGGYRADLAAEIGWDRAAHFTSQASRTAGSFTEGAILLVGLPALAMNLGWALLTFLALPGPRAKGHLGGPQPHTRD